MPRDEADRRDQPETLSNGLIKIPHTEEDGELTRERNENCEEIEKQDQHERDPGSITSENPIVAMENDIGDKGMGGKEKLRTDQQVKENRTKAENKNEMESREREAATELKMGTERTEKSSRESVINGKQKGKDTDHRNPKEQKEAKKSSELGAKKREGEILNKVGKKKSHVDRKKFEIELDDLFRPDVLTSEKKDGIQKSSNENKKGSKEKEKLPMETEEASKNEKERKMYRNKDRMEEGRREGKEKIKEKRERKDLDDKTGESDFMEKGEVRTSGKERSHKKRDGTKKVICDHEAEIRSNKVEHESLKEKQKPTNEQETGEQKDMIVEKREAEESEDIEKEKRASGEKMKEKRDRKEEKKKAGKENRAFDHKDLEAGKNMGTEKTDSKEVGRIERKKEKGSHGENRKEKGDNLAVDKDQEKGNDVGYLKEEFENSEREEERMPIENEDGIGTEKGILKEKRDNAVKDRSKENGDQEEQKKMILENETKTESVIRERNEVVHQKEYGEEVEDGNDNCRKGELEDKDEGEPENKNEDQNEVEMEENGGQRVDHEKCDGNEEPKEIEMEEKASRFDERKETKEHIEGTIEEGKTKEKMDVDNKEREINEKKRKKEKNKRHGKEKYEEKGKSKENEKEGKGKVKKKKSKDKEKLDKGNDEEGKPKVKDETEMGKKKKKKREKSPDQHVKEKNEMNMKPEEGEVKNKRKQDKENNSRKRKIKEEDYVKAKKPKTEDSVKKVKAEEEQKWKWWEEDNYEGGIKWKFLEHKGPYFAPLYEPLPDDVQFYYDGKPMKLSLPTEEVATFYGKMIDHEYTTKDVFQRNFFHDWTEVMTPEEKETITDLAKCDFTRIHKYFFDKNEARKALPKEEKQKLKLEADKITEEYGYCTLDGHREKIGNFKTEPPGLFRGRGDHPKMGMLKKRIMPKDVIINCSRESKIPQPPEGHKWKEVRCDNTVTWLASWTENIQASIKYIMLNPSSKLKGQKDWQKYETARRLKDVVDKIRAQYRADFKSREMKTRQRAVALYFIDKLALRAGNEKEEGETADTVGCCSLRVEHIKLHPKLDGKEYVVEFDFLGKDSIRYYNKVPVVKEVFRNLNRFLENKEPGDDLFDRLNTTIVNKHLQDLMDGLTAKVFRTYNASITLQEQLKVLTNEDDNVAAKILSYNRANRAVALLCNHQRALPKTHEKSMQALQAKIDAKKDLVTQAKKELKKAKADLKAKDDEKSRKEVEKKQKLRERLEEQLMKLELQATDKEENKQIALGTSKLNYLDPRITVAWCKKYGVPIEKIYNKTQRDKFAWAIDMTDENFEF